MNVEYFAIYDSESFLNHLKLLRSLQEISSSINTVQLIYRLSRGYQ